MRTFLQKEMADRLCCTLMLKSEKKCVYTMSEIYEQCGFVYPLTGRRSSVFFGGLCGYTAVRKKVATLI